MRSGRLTRIRSLVPGFTATIPFFRGAREVVAWYDADPARRRVDPAIDARMDELVERFHPAERGS